MGWTYDSREVRAALIRLLDENFEAAQHDLLCRLAERALRRKPGCKLEASELVDELFIELNRRRKEGEDGGAVVDRVFRSFEARLDGFLVAFLEQLAAERHVKWPMIKSLREHVRAALRDLPPASGELPPFITRSGRLSRPLVAKACAELLATNPEDYGTPPEVAQIAARLHEAYFVEPMAQQTQAASATRTPELEARARREADELWERIGKVLSPLQRRVLIDRLAGWHPEYIGMREKISPSTVYRTITEAERLLVESGLSRGLGSHVYTAVHRLIESKATPFEAPESDSE